jgi:hypothetical protein
MVLDVPNSGRELAGRLSGQSLILKVQGQGAIKGSRSVALSVYVAEKPQGMRLPVPPLFTSGVTGIG